VLLRGLCREIGEEMEIAGGLDSAALRFEGIINDDATR
jgi:predicted NUDIX family phosphoesterase